MKFDELTIISKFFELKIFILIKKCINLYFFFFIKNQTAHISFLAKFLINLNRFNSLAYVRSGNSSWEPVVPDFLVYSLCQDSIE